MESEELIKNIIENNFSSEYTASILAVLAYRSETVDEIYGFAKIMRQYSKKITLEDVPKVADTCGTGGDNLSTFNISTASAFCIAAHGVKVAKHGGKMVSSVSGSADILNNLGVKIDIDIAKVKNLIRNVNIGFLCQVFLRLQQFFFEIHLMKHQSFDNLHLLDLKEVRVS